MLAPKVIITYDTAPSHQWCWLPQWYSGGDSAYCLLAKFSRLNVLTIRETCEVFVKLNPKAGIKFEKGRPHYPRVDLRFSSNLSIGRLANILKLDPASLQSGFIDTLFPNSARSSAPYLKWCSTCAGNGFHSAVYQLDFVHTCPLHKTTLLHRCRKCGSQLPYELHAPTGVTLFCCPQCRADAAPTLSTPKQGFAISDESAAALASHVDLIRFADQLPTLIAKCRASAGSPHMPFVLSKPDNRQRSLSFRHFVTDVLTAVSSQGSQQAQQELHLLAPISTFVGMHEIENVRGTQSKKRRVTPGVVGVANATDQKLTEATAIYRAIRRYLWRHRVCGHRACARYAMKSLWWDLDGEKTEVFCTTALAFMRWRMHWEGRRVPSRMSERPERAAVAYGLLGWISMTAPIPSVYWSKKFEAWLNASILSAACFDSFRAWEQRCATDVRKGTIVWDFRDHDDYARRHWACSGRGTSFEPGLFFLEPLLEATSQFGEHEPFDRMHYLHSRQIIDRLKR